MGFIRESGLVCECEERGESLTLTTFVNFQILSTIIYRLATINSWLIRLLVLSMINNQSYCQSLRTVDNTGGDDTLRTGDPRDPPVITCSKSAEPFHKQTRRHESVLDFINSSFFLQDRVL